MDITYFGYNELGSHTDWRLPENRIEAFSRVTHTRFVEGDLDHHHIGKVICDYSGYDNEQKALYAMYFGQSYRNHWAMIAMQLDFWNMPEDKLIDWHNKNWRRMKFGNDTKWNVRKFPQFVIDMRKKIGKGSLYEYLGNAANVGSTKENYFNLNKTLQNFYSFGRMTAWLGQQTLYEFFDWDIDHWDQQLYDNATWSQYDSICYLFDRIDIARKQKKNDGSIVKYEPTKADIKLMEEKTFELMEQVNKRIPFHVDIYNIESVECEFRKTAYGPKIKEFTFWTTNELIEGYDRLREAWADYDDDVKVNWLPYEIGFMTKGNNLVDNYGYHQEYFKILTHFGLNLNTHYLYKDEIDAHKLLNLPKIIPPSLQTIKNSWNTLSASEQEDLKIRYNPVRFLKFKDKNHPAWADKNVDYSYTKGFIS
jgi:hypothetical protein